MFEVLSSCDFTSFFSGVRPTAVKPAQVVDLTQSGPSSGSGANPINQAKSKYPALLVHPKPQDGQLNHRRR